MKFLLFEKILNDQRLSADRMLKDIPSLWEDLEEDFVDGIVQDYLDSTIDAKTVYRKLQSVYGLQSEKGLKLIYTKGMASKNKKITSKSTTLSLPIYLYDILRDFKKEGGQMSQLAAAAMDEVFSRLGDSNVKKLQYVNQWLHDRFRDPRAKMAEAQQDWENKAKLDMDRRKRRDRKRTVRDEGIAAVKGVPIKRKRATSTMDAELESDDNFKGQSHEEIMEHIHKQRKHNDKVDADAKKKTEA